MIKSSKILGINARNLLYLRPFNKEKAIELADDKVKTKRFLSARGIPVSKLYTTFKSIKAYDKFSFKKYSTGFVIKPNQGCKGKGILQIERIQGGKFLLSDGKIIDREQLRKHVYAILNGNFSLSGLSNDMAIMEHYIRSHGIMKELCEIGLPDIRVIVFNLIPVMAMIRIPTKESKGKANLHQGAIGAGIDIAKGEITHGYYKGKYIKELPNKKYLIGVKIPYWDQILEIACKAQLATNLGYLAADIAIDRQIGPLLLEINARAGLGIQIINKLPLRYRLEKIRDLDVKTISKGIRIAKDLFGFDLERNINTITGKKVLGLFEEAEIITKNGTHNCTAKINPSKKNTLLSIDFAHKIGLSKSKKVKKVDTEKTYGIKVKIGGKTIITKTKLEKIKKNKYQLIIGRNELSGNFIIDPSLKRKGEQKGEEEKKKTIFSRGKFNAFESDSELAQVISQIKFLSYFRPYNLAEERQKFVENNFYNPKLIYKPVNIDIDNLRTKLSKIRYDESDAGYLIKNRIKQSLIELDMIENRGRKEMFEINKSLFGYPDESIIHTKKERIKTTKDKSQNLTPEEVKKIFEETLSKYGLNNWKIKLHKNLLSTCVTNKNRKLLLNENFTYSEKKVKNLIIHEIETHLITAENGMHQDFRLFNLGFANHLETQEGLAIFNSVKNGFQNAERFALLQAQTIFLAGKMGFSELYGKLREMGFKKKHALNLCFRVKRGYGDTSKEGAFCKDYSYYKGFIQIKDFLSEGGELKDLYYGKYNLKDIKKIKNVINDRYVPILPDFLNEIQKNTIFSHHD